jgi:hypothetical protein
LAFVIFDVASFAHLSSSLTNTLFLARRLLSMLCERVLRVRAQSALGVVRVLLRALGDIATLVVDVAAGLARLGLGLALGLGGLAAGVGCGHDDVYVVASTKSEDC